MSALAVTVYQGRAGDHNPRALVGARVLGLALADRLGVAPVVIAEPKAVIDDRWEFEMAAAREDFGLLAMAIDASMAQGRRPISVLTRCAAALPTIPIVVRHRQDTCVVWFDAHADLNTPATTPSSYLGGMALAGVTGLWNSGLGDGLDLSQVILVGTREIDAPEQAVLDAHRVTFVPVQKDVAGALARAIAGRPVYVHLDCDVLEPGLVATDYAVQGGLTPSQLRDACAAIAKSEVVGLEIAEFEGAGNDGDTANASALVLDALQPLLDCLAGRRA
jgi:arginase